MKFLVLTQYFPPEVGASQVRLASMCSELAIAGHQVEVVTAMPHHPAGRIFPTYRKNLYLREQRNGIPVHRVWLYAGNGSAWKRILSYLSFSITCIYGLLQARRPDYVFVDSPPLFLGLPAWLASTFWRVPLIFNVADLWPDSVRGLRLMQDGLCMRLAFQLEAWLYRHSNYVTAVTDGIRKVLLSSKRVPQSKILFLPNGADTRLFQQSPPNDSLKQALGLSGKRVLLYAGNHGHAGAVEQILYAADLLRDDPAIHFLFIGEGPEKEKLKILAHSLSLSNVTFLDAVPIENLPGYISISDAAVVTLRKSEITKGARPAKSLVMMAAGKPIVLAGEGESEDLINRAGAGVVVPPESPAKLAEAIRGVLADRRRMQLMGASGRSYVSSHLGWPVLVQTWLAHLLGESSPRPICPEIGLKQEAADVVS